MVQHVSIGVSNEEGTRVVRVAGWLSRHGLGALEDIIQQSDGPVRLDLSGLRFAEKPAVEMIRTLRGSGVPVVGSSPYIANLLGQASGQGLS